MNNKLLKLMVGVITFIAMLTAGLAIQQQTASAATKAQGTKLVKTAKKQLGKRYVYGATGPGAFDCSGLTSYVYKKATKKVLPRTASQQYAKYKHVSGKHLKKGDLIFFNYGSGIAHVGIFVGKGMMIDAQNRGVVKESYKASWWRPYISGYARVN